MIHKIALDRTVRKLWTADTPFTTRNLTTEPYFDFWKARFARLMAQYTTTLSYPGVRVLAQFQLADIDDGLVNEDLAFELSGSIFQNIQPFVHKFVLLPELQQEPLRKLQTARPSPLYLKNHKLARDSEAKGKAREC